MEQQRIQYILHLADNALILGQRNAAWCGHGPVLEQDIAITNISLDLIGQARHLYQYAAELKNDGSTEDDLAYLRTERDFMNCLLAERPNGDWGQTILRQFFFSAYQSLLYQQLCSSSDAQLAAIAAKALKEVTYHLRWSSEWVIRLGDGTAESHARMNRAIEALWAYTGELFMPAGYERIPEAVDPAILETAWKEKVQQVFSEATLQIPVNIYMQRGGKSGVHTEELGFILAEMQYMQRAFPGCEW
jgi:ring-1,2-phenylacetyl-CoA epoxidase subunit PaaC